VDGEALLRHLHVLLKHQSDIEHAAAELTGRGAGAR
jgi:hypothetical protein